MSLAMSTDVNDVSTDPVGLEWHSRAFVPQSPVRIDSNGGNIGRFYWQNQRTLTIEAWDSSRDPYQDGAPSWWILSPTEIKSSEVHGDSSFLFTLGDWWNWVLS